MKKTLLILAAYFCITVVFATDYYVDATNGNDSNNGTSIVAAWKTLSKVNSFTFSAGDNLFLKTGEVWNEQLLLNDSGTNGNPITVNQYGTGNKPIINGGGLLTNSAATVLIKNAEYLEINNLELTNTNGNTNYQGDLWGLLGEIDIAGGMEANHIYIRDCYIHDVNGDVATKTTGGIYMTAFGTDPSRYNGLRIEDNVIDNVGGLGIANQSPHASISSSTRYPSLNIEIRRNKISNTGRNNLIIRASDHSVVEYNTFAYTSRHDTGHSIFCFNTESVKIQYNEAYGNTGSGNKDRGAYDADYNCKNTLIQYNYSHDNFWGFAIMKRSVNENVVIRYNISENDSKSIYFYGFEGSTGLTTANFYNNTHYVKSGIQLTVFGAGEHQRTAIKTNFYNNIFYFEDFGSTWGNYDSNNVTFENNSYYNIASLGTNFVTGDPLFVNPNNGGQDIDWDNYPNVLTGYKLQAGSPCIDAGRIVANNGGFDFWGVPLYNNAPDIGAGEYVDATGNNTPTDITLAPSSIQENNSPGSLVGTLSATDADATDIHIFYFVEGAGDEDNGTFNIVANELFANDEFDYETKNSYNVRVKTTDNKGASFEKQLSISVLDIEPENSAIIINVAEDSYVRGGNNSNTNYGSSTIVRVKESSNSSFSRRGFMKFDLSNFSSSVVETAQLHVYGSAQQVMDMFVYSIADDSWSESTITWNNAPSLGSNLGSVSVDITDQWYVIDVTSAVQTELSGDGTLSVGLKDDNTLIKTINLFSKENSSGQFQAYLSIEAAAPQPTTNTTIAVNADAFVRDGSNANNNYGSDTELYTKLASSSFTRESYLKFDVSTLATLGTIINAKLVMEPTIVGSSAGSTQIEVKAVADDSWTESGITWNNKPSQGTVIDSQAGSAQTMEWNVTPQVTTEVAGDGIITLALSSTPSGSQNFVRYNSKEISTENLRPKLLVEYQAAPVQASKDVFLIIGQSNTAGRAQIETQDMQTLTDVYLLNAQGQWEAAENPLNKYSTIRKNLSDQGLGYGYTFGKYMNEILSEDIGLVVNARGGSNINDWIKGASLDYYGEALTRIQTALSISGSNLKGVLWHQGESNKNDGIAYITKLESIIDDFRADLNMPNLPFIAGQISQKRPENADFNNNVIPTLPSTVANTDFVRSDYLDAFDLTHFDSEAQRVLGGRYASKVLELVYGYQIVTDTIWVTEDSYVRAGSNANTNYNSETVLRVKTRSDSNFTRESFLKFDLSGVSDQIIDAIFVVNGLSSEGGSLDVTFYETTDSWSESTITWNNKPASGDALEVLTVAETTDTNYSIFLSEYAQETQVSDNVLSVTLKNSSSTSGQFRFKSKEDAANQPLRPYLLVTTVSAVANKSLSTRTLDLDVEDTIDDLGLNNEILVYPNPVADRLNFRNLSDVQSIAIMGIDGRIIARNLNVKNAKSSGFSTSNLKSGLYLIRFMKKDGKVVIKKIMK